MPKVTEEEAAHLHTKWISAEEATRLLNEQSGRTDIRQSYVRVLAMKANKVRYRQRVAAKHHENLYHQGDLKKIIVKKHTK